MFFGKKKTEATPAAPATPPAPAMDEAYPHLSAERANAMRRQVSEAIRHEGGEPDFLNPQQVEVRVDGELTGTYGLDNLSRQLSHIESEEEAAEEIITFVRGVMRHSDMEDLGSADFYRQLKLRLAPSYQLEQLSAENPPAGLSEFVPGIISYLVNDAPTAVETFSEEIAAEHDTIDELIRFGRENLWKELLGARDNVAEIPLETAPAAPLHVVESDSFFISSAPIFGAEILKQWFPTLDQRRGVLLAFPHRHVLLAREVTTGTDLMQAITGMAGIAAGQFETQPGHLSPAVHLLYDGELTPFTFLQEGEDGETSIGIAPSEYLMDLINVED